MFFCHVFYTWLGTFVARATRTPRFPHVLLSLTLNHNAPSAPRLPATASRLTLSSATLTANRTLTNPKKLGIKNLDLFLSQIDRVLEAPVVMFDDEMTVVVPYLEIVITAEVTQFS